jgi:hypothetical protein
MCNEPLLTSILSELEEYYGGQILNGKILENTWRNGLARLSDQQVQIAVARCFQKHPRKYNYFPCVDDILELARGSLPAENPEIYKVQSINNLQIPPEDDQKAHKRGLIGRLYLCLKIKKRVGKTELEKQDFYKKFESYSIEELSNLLEIERPEIRRNSTHITPEHAATPEAQEYARKLHQLITRKTL